MFLVREASQGRLATGEVGFADGDVASARSRCALLVVEVAAAVRQAALCGPELVAQVRTLVGFWRCVPVRGLLSQVVKDDTSSSRDDQKEPHPPRWSRRSMAWWLRVGLHRASSYPIQDDSRSLRTSTDQQYVGVREEVSP